MPPCKEARRKSPDSIRAGPTLSPIRMTGPHTPNQWVSRSAFQQLTPARNPGQFGNEGRNAIRGPGLATVDLSLFKNFAITESATHSVPGRSFNMLNHANFALPENDLASPEFGQILQAAPPRLLQLAVKVLLLEKDSPPWNPCF